MRKLGEDYKENVAEFNRLLRVDESFDLIKKRLIIGDGEATFYYIDGFIKDTVMQKLMMHFLSVGKIKGSALDFMQASVPYIETEVASDIDKLVTAVMSGCTVCLGTSFGESAIIIDTRTYPARDTEEPEGDRVMRGSRAG